MGGIMTTKKFRISYIHPETVETKEVIQVFSDSVDIIYGRKVHISAEEWAEDYAYTLADKGDYLVKEIK